MGRRKSHSINLVIIYLVISIKILCSRNKCNSDTKSTSKKINSYNKGDPSLLNYKTSIIQCGFNKKFSN